MTKRRAFSSYFIIVFLVISIISISSCKKEESQIAEVNIALNLPMTGQFAIYGQMVREGVQLALDDLDKVNSPIKLNFDFQDNAGVQSQTIAVMQKQFLKRVDIYSSGVKPQTMAIFDQVVSKKVPYFVWIYDAFICRDHDNVFRTWISFKQEPLKYFEYIEYKKAKKLAVVYPNLPHIDEELYQILFPKLEKIGISKDDIFIETFPWDKMDFKDVFAKVKEFQPELIVIIGFYDNLAQMVRTLKANDMVKNGNIISGYDLVDASTILSPEELEGMRVVTSIFNTRGEEPATKEWKKRFKEKFNKDPLYTHAYAYDMAMMIADAAKKLKLPAASEQWIDALKSVDIKGITGRLKFDKDGDLDIQLDVGVYKNGRLEKDI